MTYRSATVGIEIILVLLDSGDLLVQTQYDVTSEKMEWSLKGMPINCCSSRSIEDLHFSLWLRNGSPLDHTLNVRRVRP